MLKGLFNIATIAEWIAFIAAIILLRKRTGRWRLFIVLLFLTIVVEAIGWFEAYHLKRANNSTPFNFLLIINLNFVLWIFCDAEPLRRNRRTFYWVMTIFSAFALVNIIRFQGLHHYNSITDVVADITMATMSCYYFYAVLHEDRFRNLLRDEYYWLAMGTLFYSLGATLLFLFLDYFLAYYKKTGFNVFSYLNYSLNVLLYGSYVLAFICRYRNTKSLPPL